MFPNKFPGVSVEIEVTEGDTSGVDTLTLKVDGAAVAPSALPALLGLAAVASLWPAEATSVKLPWRICNAIRTMIHEEIANANEVAALDAEIAAIVASDPDEEIANLVAAGLEKTEAVAA